MKLLATAVFAGFMALSTTACAKEEPKKETAVAAAPAASDAAAPAAPKPEYKTVCLDVQGKDGKPVIGKDGKPRQNCTKVRVRQKFEGTKIEDAKKN
jgi:hypothetical protein